MVTCVGRDVVPWVCHASSQDAGFQRSQFWGITFYSHSVWQNDQIRHGNTSGTGVFLGDKPRHCMWHKCIARFVSVLSVVRSRFSCVVVELNVSEFVNCRAYTRASVLRALTIDYNVAVPWPCRSISLNIHRLSSSSVANHSNPF